MHHGRDCAVERFQRLAQRERQHRAFADIEVFEHFTVVGDQGEAGFELFQAHRQLDRAIHAATPEFFGFQRQLRGRELFDLASVSLAVDEEVKVLAYIAGSHQNSSVRYLLVRWLRNVMCSAG